jgi:hypothetical protein
MSNRSAHIAKRSMRRMIAASLTVIYLVIALSPLTPFAMYSPVVAHAVTGECSGDCDICGCSPESRANHTCCCAKKKQMQARNAKLPIAEHCSSKAATAPATVKGGCIAASQPVTPVVARKASCAKCVQQHDGDDQEIQRTKERPHNETIYKCGSPCGKGNLQALANAGSSELLPYIYSELTGPPHEDTNHSNLLQRMASRYAAPPDPPPRLAVSA